MTICLNVPSGKGCGSVRLWAFCLKDLAELFGMSEVATRQAMHRGKFDPRDLKSVMAFALSRLTAAEQ